MKGRDFMEALDITTILSFVTAIVTCVFAEISKRFGWVESKYIPYQNALIGILAGVIVWCVRLTDNLGTAIIICVISAFGAGGGYDLVKSCGEGSEKK